MIAFSETAKGVKESTPPNATEMNCEGMVMQATNKLRKISNGRFNMPYMYSSGKELPQIFGWFSPASKKKGLLARRHCLLDILRLIFLPCVARPEGSGGGLCACCLA